jgi:hypothetical protein
MVLIVSTSRFPLTKAKEVGKKYIEVSKQFKIDRSLEKPILRLATRIYDDYVETISITEVKEGKYEELMRIITAQQLMYDKIEGLKFRSETFFSGAEALPMVGLEMPE